MSVKKSILIRVRLAFLVIAIFGAVVLYRIFDLQVNQGEKWRAMADQIGLKYMTVKATRGNIYSDNGSLLATSLPFYNVAFDPSIASDRLFQA
ncbi:MAG: cell division protein, partial [Bacteroidota bacterium]